MLIATIFYRQPLAAKLHFDLLLFGDDLSNDRELTRSPRVPEMLLGQREEQLEVLSKIKSHLEEFVLVAR